MQGKHIAADHPHAKPADHAPAQAAVPSRNIVETSTMDQDTRAAHTIHMASMSIQAQARSRAQTSACSAQCCSASGTMPRMLIMAASSFSLTATGRCGGNVTNAQMASLMPGKLALQTDPMVDHVPSVQIKEHVSTTRLPSSVLTLLQSSVSEIKAQLMTTQLAVGRRCCGNANMDMNTLLPLTVGQPKAVAVPNVLPPAAQLSLGNNILC